MHSKWLSFKPTVGRVSHRFWSGVIIDVVLIGALAAHGDHLIWIRD